MAKKNNLKKVLEQAEALLECYCEEEDKDTVVTIEESEPFIEKEEEEDEDLMEEYCEDDSEEELQPQIELSSEKEKEMEVLGQEMDNLQQEMDNLEQEIGSEEEMEDSEEEDVVYCSEDDSECITLFKDEDLSESFKRKLSVLFASAVNKRINESVKKIAKRQTKKIERELSEQVGNFIDVNTKIWLNENKVNLVKNIKSQIAESVISQLKGVFESNDLSLPDAKISLVEKVRQENKEIKNKYNKLSESLSETVAQIKLLKKEMLLKEHTSDMNDLDASKLKTLAEAFKYTNDVEFIEKIQLIKKNFSKQSSSKLSESTSVDNNSDSLEEIFGKRGYRI